MDYKEELRKKLPELKAIEGYPIGSDDNIIAISNPPHYTACPNPFISDFISQYGKTYDQNSDQYFVKPFVGDVSEGKREPIYNLHSYHTKVPYKAIMNYIDHYTEEGDIVLDAFCGTGMTGVAASQLNRKCILSDLSTIASFIAHNYNNPYDPLKFKIEASRILAEVQDEYGWMFETTHGVKKTKVRFDSMVWSDVLISPFSNEEFVFFDVAFDIKNNRVSKTFKCPHTGANLTKSDCKLATETVVDKVTGNAITRRKQVPVRIHYSIGRKKFIKRPDEYDLDILSRIDQLAFKESIPIFEIPDGEKLREFHNKHVTYLHELYTKRLLIILSAIKSKCTEKIHHIWFSTHLVNLSILNRYRPEVSFPYNPFSGTFYLASMNVEADPFKAYSNKIKNFEKALPIISDGVVVSVNSATNLPVPDNSIDYIFTDPPFGHNLMYAELNFIWEQWLRVSTNNKSEAVISRFQNKKLPEYYDLMIDSFKEYFRVLKPKRWITVEFHNSKSSVWNAIQEGMSKAGFIVSQVSVLDKKQGSFNQVTASGATKSDLVISAFKPDADFQRKFSLQSGQNLEAEFVGNFLQVLEIKPSIERTEKMLYSKMLAYYIQNGYEINQDAKTFYKLLNANFIEEDGFWFTSDQINSYIEYKKYAKLNEIEEIKSGGLFLFVTDEKSALVWLHNFLNQPKSFSEVSVAFNQLANIQDDQVPELRNLLEENFVFEGGLYRRPKSEEEHNQITEKRQKQLWKQFESILIQAQTERKKIKEVRKEALTYGFERCYKDKRFKDILTIASKLHPSILENNGELADFVEAAEIQTEGLA